MLDSNKVPAQTIKLHNKNNRVDYIDVFVQLNGSEDIILSMSNTETKKERTLNMKSPKYSVNINDMINSVITDSLEVMEFTVIKENTIKFQYTETVSGEFGNVHLLTSKDNNLVMFSMVDKRE